MEARREVGVTPDLTPALSSEEREKGSPPFRKTRDWIGRATEEGKGGGGLQVRHARALTAGASARGEHLYADLIRLAWPRCCDWLSAQSRSGVTDHQAQDKNLLSGPRPESATRLREAESRKTVETGRVKAENLKCRNAEKIMRGQEAEKHWFLDL
jgi:hypothetical protein